MEFQGVTWAEDFACAMACKNVLASHSINDVECEIRETRVLSIAGPKLQRLEAEDRCEGMNLHFTQTLDQGIATMEKPTLEGTLGLYLKQNQPAQDRPYALTNRHVVFHPDSDDRKAYKREIPGQPPVQVIQPSDTKLQETREGSNEMVDVWSHPDRYGLDKEFAATRLESAKQTARAIKSMKDADHRVIGYVRAVGRWNCNPHIASCEMGP